MPEFWIKQGSEYARVTQGSKYARTWVYVSKKDVNMPEYIWIYVNIQSSEYGSFLNMLNTVDTALQVTLQVNEDLLRDEPIQNSAEGIK